MRLRLVVPADVDEPTGGNVYDLAVADALRRDGDEVDVLRCEPVALPSVLRRPWTGHTLIDGLLACPQPDVIAAAPVGVVVHMPLALETGLSGDRARELGQLERQALHAATVVLSTSQWCAHYLAEHHALDDVAVATPGVAPADVTAGSDPPMLVQLAAMLRHKNQLGVVAALSRLKELPWQARLAGSVDRDPAYASAVREAVTGAGLTARVEIPGVMARDTAWTGADLALLPSRVESYGMVVTEALARGIPVVVSEGGAAEALGVDEHGNRPGVVIAPGDNEGLTRALRRWLTEETYRDTLRTSALSRRRTLEGWETTARLVRLALISAR